MCRGVMTRVWGTNIYIEKERKKANPHVDLSGKKEERKKEKSAKSIFCCYFSENGMPRTLAYRCESFEDRVIQIEFEGLHGKLS